MITVTELKNHLKSKSTDQLTNEIIDLFKNINQVKNYYNNRLSSSNEVLEKYKKIIEKKIMPSKNFSNDGLHLAEAKKVISEFKKLTKNPFDIVDIMLFYVETGVILTKTYGDIDENFYNSMANMYKKTLEFINKNNLKEEFKTRCLLIVENTSGIGWGFHDDLSELFHEFFDY